MRMWMLPPIILCQQHLLGEHGEHHKHRHIFVKKYRITNHMKPAQPAANIFPALMKKRHDELAEELLRRGRNHKSPFVQPDVSYLPVEYLTAVPNLEYNIFDLCDRCFECYTRYIQYRDHNGEGL